MAANAGSMFQYWKRFDLQQLQVSLSLTTLPRFLNAVSARFSPAAAVQAFLRLFSAVFLDLLLFPGPSFSPLIKAALSR
ncbi:Protein CASP [Bagarius yarrelli]|uniref:Protein CASP n=1 Tax=Bagarius yarrelli TaxID=175774 RepID=A0A556U717_BAGYA|nr:Protein CASP [Bagarius yarrelli]